MKPELSGIGYAGLHGCPFTVERGKVCSQPPPTMPDKQPVERSRETGEEHGRRQDVDLSWTDEV